MEKYKILISSHIWVISELDDIMETLSDLDWLNEEGKKVRTKIWIKTRKESRKETREEKMLRIMNDDWDRYDDWTQNYLISNIDSMNDFSKNFIKSKIELWK